MTDPLYQPIQCQYCQSIITKINQEQHVLECLDQEIDCIYSDIGCEIKVKRKEVSLHETRNQPIHTRMIYNNFKTQISQSNEKSSTEILILKQENAELKNKIRELEIQSNTFNKIIEKKSQEILFLKNEVEKTNIVMNQKHIKIILHA